jgi:hypothetical protein
MKAARLGSDKSTADQLRILQTQARAMQDQIEAVREGQRAYLRVTSINGVSIRHPRGTDVVSVEIRAKYKNIGQTPAQQVFLC